MRLSGFTAMRRLTVLFLLLVFVEGVAADDVGAIIEGIFYLCQCLGLCCYCLVQFCDATTTRNVETRVSERSPQLRPQQGRVISYTNYTFGDNPTLTPTRSMREQNGNALQTHQPTRESYAQELQVPSATRNTVDQWYQGERLAQPTAPTLQSFGDDVPIHGRSETTKRPDTPPPRYEDCVTDRTNEKAAELIKIVP